MSDEWVIYGQENCSQCNVAKMRLKTKGIDFEYVDLTNSPEKKSELVSATRCRSMPIIFLNGQYYGDIGKLLTDRSL